MDGPPWETWQDASILNDDEASLSHREREPEEADFGSLGSSFGSIDSRPSRISINFDPSDAMSQTEPQMLDSFLPSWAPGFADHDTLCTAHRDVSSHLQVPYNPAASPAQSRASSMLLVPTFNRGFSDHETGQFFSSQSQLGTESLYSYNNQGSFPIEGSASSSDNHQHNQLVQPSWQTPQNTQYTWPGQLDQPSFDLYDIAHFKNNAQDSQAFQSLANAPMISKQMMPTKSTPPLYRGRSSSTRRVSGTTQCGRTSSLRLTRSSSAHRAWKHQYQASQCNQALETASNAQSQGYFHATARIPHQSIPHFDGRFPFVGEVTQGELPPLNWSVSSQAQLTFAPFSGYQEPPDVTNLNSTPSAPAYTARRSTDSQGHNLPSGSAAPSAETYSQQDLTRNPVDRNGRGDNCSRCRIAKIKCDHTPTSHTAAPGDEATAPTDQPPMCYKSQFVKFVEAGAVNTFAPYRIHYRPQHTGPAEVVNLPETIEWSQLEYQLERNRAAGDIAVYRGTEFLYRLSPGGCLDYVSSQGPRTAPTLGELLVWSQSTYRRRSCPSSDWRQCIKNGDSSKDLIDMLLDWGPMSEQRTFVFVSTTGRGSRPLHPQYDTDKSLIIIAAIFDRIVLRMVELQAFALISGIIYGRKPIEARFLNQLALVILTQRRQQAIWAAHPFISRDKFHATNRLRGVCQRLYVCYCYLRDRYNSRNSDSLPSEIRFRCPGTAEVRHIRIPTEQRLEVLDQWLEEEKTLVKRMFASNQQRR